MKIVIIGAGSGFGGRLSMDILASQHLQDVTIALCDIHTGRLEQVRVYVQKLIDANNLPARCIASTDYHELMPGADIVITAASIGGPAYWGQPFYSEIEIPRKYGIDQFCGDTLGPGGVFRFLRSAKTHLQFCRDMERHCPDALLLNYTNPMAMLTWVHSTQSSIQNVGLCHSIQGTTRLLAKAVDVPYDEVNYTVAGINHQAWVLSLKRGREDLLPKLREVADTSEVLAKEKVRVEMMRQFGYFPTESTKHNSEYLPYFRRTQEMREYFGIDQPRVVPLDGREVREWEKDSGVEDDGTSHTLIRSFEYASYIIEARRTGVPFLFYANVMNGGAISNLPADSCVEVPCVAEREGIRSCQVGALPAQCAALNRTNINVQELAVLAFREQSREAAFHAVALDPLTASILPLHKIRSMFDELWEVEKDLIGFN